MAGLWRNNPETPEGKYPIVLRRDGTVLNTPYLVITLRDPCASAAIWAYAERAEKLGLDAEYVHDMRELAVEAEHVRNENAVGDPDAPKHRTDDPNIIAWARSLCFQGRGDKPAGEHTGEGQGATDHRALMSVRSNVPALSVSAASGIVSPARRALHVVSPGIWLRRV